MSKPGWRDRCRLLLWEDSWQPTVGVRGIWVWSRPKSCCSLLRGRGATWATSLSLHRSALTPLHVRLQLQLHLPCYLTAINSKTAIFVFCDSALVSCCSSLPPAGPRLTLHDVTGSGLGLTKLVWPRLLGCTTGCSLPEKLLLRPCQGILAMFLAEIRPGKWGPHQHRLRAGTRPRSGSYSGLCAPDAAGNPRDERVNPWMDE